ncbi:hypothetical protein [Lysobacter sp. CA199]|uniref:hypothetical protein n=1 Tax=Lysobacter sp. CA199 TaxID=3455608 RepID=UPI003F8CFC7F
MASAATWRGSVQSLRSRFFRVAADEESAIDFAVQILRCEEKVSCHYDPENAAFPMDVQVHPHRALLRQYFAAAERTALACGAIGRQVRRLGFCRLKFRSSRTGASIACAP